MSFELANKKIQLSWDENGILTGLTNLETGTDFINPGGFFQSKNCQCKLKTSP